MKFRAKMTVCMVWLLALAYGIGGSLLIASSFSASLDQEKESARQSCQMLVNTMSVLNSYSDISGTFQRLESYGNTEWDGLAILSNGSVIYKSGEPAIWNSTDENILMVAEQRILISCPVGSGLTRMQLRAVYDISAIYAQRNSQMQIYRWTFLVVVAIGTALSWIMCTWLTAPLRALTRASRSMAEGNLSSRVRVTSEDEVGRLSAEFNVMADKLQDSMEEMRRTMERQEEFMGSFAHELKTPMTSIIGYADLLRSTELSEQDRRESANYVFSEGKRLESLSLKLLDLLVLEREDTPMQPSSPKTLIEAMAKEFHPILKKQNITMVCRCQKGNCLLEPDLFKSLLYNLMDNARKAMDQGGQIMIQSEMTEDGCRIRVIDNGRGMPEEALQRITEAFYRVDKSRSRAQGGAGLGLALCSRIVELHRGEIEFSSREGVGTCVTVMLRGGAA